VAEYAPSHSGTSSAVRGGELVRCDTQRGLSLLKREGQVGTVGGLVKRVTGRRLGLILGC